MTTTESQERLVEFPALKDAQGKLDEKRKGLAGILAEAGPDYDMSKVKTLSGATAAKVAEIGKMNAEIDECKSKVDELLVVARAAAQAVSDEDNSGFDGGEAPPVKGKAKPWGELLMNSPAVKGYVAGSGRGPQARIEVDLKTLFQTTAGWDPEDTRTGRV